MAAPPLANSFEGGSDGTTITTGNSGGASGQAFDQVEGALNYSATQARGTLSAQSVDQTVATRVRWNTIGSVTFSVFTRMYLWLSVQSATDEVWFHRSLTSAAAGNAGLVIRPNGHMTGRNAGNTNIAASEGAVTVPIGSWFRVEMRTLPSTTVGEVEWRWWSNPDATGAPDDSGSATGQVLGANYDTVIYGLTPTNPSPLTFYMDDLAIGTSHWIGPAVVGDPGSRFEPVPFRGKGRNL